RHAVSIDQSESKSVPRGAMLGRVCLQVPPQVLGEGVLLIDLRLRSDGVVLFSTFASILWMKDRAQARPVLWQSQILPREVCRFTKPDDQDALAMLRHEVRAIDDLAGDVVSQILLENLLDDSKGVSLVMTDKVFHVFEEECLRPLCFQNPRNIEEKCALGFVGKSMRSTKCDFL